MEPPKKQLKVDLNLGLLTWGVQTTIPDGVETRTAVVTKKLFDLLYKVDYYSSENADPEPFYPDFKVITEKEIQILHKFRLIEGIDELDEIIDYHENKDWYNEAVTEFKKIKKYN